MRFDDARLSFLQLHTPGALDVYLARVGPREEITKVPFVGLHDRYEPEDFEVLSYSGREE